MKCNRTELVFNLGNKLFKFAIYKLHKINEKAKLVQYFENINKVEKKEIERFNQIIKLIPSDKLFKIFTAISWETNRKIRYR